MWNEGRANRRVGRASRLHRGARDHHQAHRQRQAPRMDVPTGCARAAPIPCDRDHEPDIASGLWVRHPARLYKDLTVVLHREVVAVEVLAERTAVPVLASVADERGRLQPRAPVLQVVGAVRVTLAAELALHAPALVARLADIAPRAFVAVGTAVVDAPDSALVGLDRPTLDLAHGGLRRPAELLRDGVERLARVQSCLYGEAFHRGQPHLLQDRPSFARCLVCVHVVFPFCVRPSGALDRIA